MSFVLNQTDLNHPIFREKSNANIGIGTPLQILATSIILPTTELSQVRLIIYSELELSEENLIYQKHDNINRK